MRVPLLSISPKFILKKMIRKSDYIKNSRAIVWKLDANGCYGKGSIHEVNLLSAFPNKKIAKEVLGALVKQNIVLKKKHKRGLKYYLNKERYDKIRQILGEKGRNSIIPSLLLL